MAITLTTSYQVIASGTKSFTAGGYSQTAKQIIYAKYKSIDESKMTAIVSVKTAIKSNKSGYSWTSSGNTQTIVLDNIKKTKSLNVGTVTTSEQTTYEVDYTVTYDENGEWLNKSLSANIDVYSSYKASASGSVSLPNIDVANTHIGIDGVIKKAQAYIGIDGTPKKCDVYLGVNGTPKKCS